MFGKKKESKQEPSFQRNSEYSVLSEVIKGEVEKNNRPEIMALSARLSSDTQIEATIKFGGIMMIDGNVNGEISTDNGKFVVSESGIINATITAKRINQKPITFNRKTSVPAKQTRLNRPGKT